MTELPPPADLEIWLRRRDVAYEAIVSFRAPGSPVDVQLVLGPPPLVLFDNERLLANALDPQSYGQALTKMLFAEERLARAFIQAREQADAVGVPLRLRLRLDVESALHTLRWETLRDPHTGAALAAGTRVLLTRSVASADTSRVLIGARGALSALVAVAGPINLDQFGLSRVDVGEEQARALAALPDVPTKALPRVTINSLAIALQDEPDILYMVGHGTIVDGEPYLWLEYEDGTAAPTPAGRIADLLQGLTRRPLLVVLASCQSAAASNSASQLALAPRLATAGVAAVLAMQDTVSYEAIARGMPAFFAELLRYGMADRAVAAMRYAFASVGEEWWKPVLLLRLRDGRLWLNDEVELGTAISRQLGLDAPTETQRQVIAERITDAPRRPLFEQAGLCVGYPLRPAPDEFFVSHEASPEKIADLRQTLARSLAARQLTPYTADSDIGPGHRLCKIAAKIETTAFGIFDLPSARDHNVYLELGVAIGLGRPFVITARTNAVVPAHLDGLDILGFSTYSGLRRELGAERRFQVGQFVTLLPSEPVSPSNSYFVADGDLDSEDFRSAIEAALAPYRLNPTYLGEEAVGSELALTALARTLMASRFAIFRADGEANPETFLALGIAIGLARPWILISRSGTAIPADLRGLSHLNFSSYVQLEDNFVARCASFLSRYAELTH